MTLNTPISSGSSYDETCVWLGCTAAKGKSTEQDVFDAIWNEFQTITITTRDNRLLSYWGNGEFTGDYNTTNALLENGDGRCSAWADFFFNTIRLQGISGIYKYIINFNSVYKDVGNVRYTFLALKQLGNIFQGRLTTSSEYMHNELFANHAFNKYNNYYYDPTVQNNNVYDDIEDYLANNIEIWGFNNTTLTYEKIEPYDNNITYSSFFQYQLCNLEHNNGLCDCQSFLCQPEGD